MSQQSRITRAQLDILDQFTCQRLTDAPENRDLTWSFFCDRNPHLAQNLRSDAWYEDREGVPTVYYIVKNARGRIALYFSLRCGVLFDPNYVRDVMERYDHTRELMDALENRDCREWAREHLEMLRGRYSTVPLGKQRRIRGEFRQAKNAKRVLLGDQEAEPNEKMIRVDEAFPAIELVHFCVNDLIRGEWASYNMGRPIGEVMFWHFVVPKMLEINRLIGCEYAYLFAADGTRDGTLINYYETALHFERLKHIGAIKPQYDFYCIFMGKRLLRMSRYRRNCLDESLCGDEDPLGLADYREDFFEHFNIPPGEELV